MEMEHSDLYDFSPMSFIRVLLFTPIKLLCSVVKVILTPLSKANNNYLPNRLEKKGYPPPPPPNNKLMGFAAKGLVAGICAYEAAGDEAA